MSVQFGDTSTTNPGVSRDAQTLSGNILTLKLAGRLFQTMLSSPTSHAILDLLHCLSFFHSLELFRVLGELFFKSF